MEARFSSLDGGDGLRAQVVDVLADAVAAHRGAAIDVNIMTFSFTDAAIASLLAEVARSSPGVTIRIIADWGQGSALRDGPVRWLAALGLVNVVVRYKHDQPYTWDPTQDRLRWSYHASRGLLHHKTMGVFVDGRPTALVCGSFNWTAKAVRAYENVLVIRAGDDGALGVMEAMEREFEAMWSDGLVTLSTIEAREHHRRILQTYRRHPATPPADVVGLERGCDVASPGLARSAGPAGDGTDGADGTIAFSSRAPHQAHAEAGYAALNRARRFELRKPGGRSKRVPLTLTNLALDVIARAGEGDTLKVAMYGLSPRVPEYGALLDAARRGARLQVLLDGRVGRAMVAQLATVLVREELAIQLRATGRTMHQKYVLHPQSATVLTGTANFSTDASQRHTEHRLVARQDPRLAAQFLTDFADIWARTPSPFRLAPGGRAHA